MTDIPFTLTRRNKWDDPEGYTTVQGPAAYDQRRWVTAYSRVISDSARFFDLSWEEPNTDQQEGSESDDIEVSEVYPHQVMTTVYKDKPADV